MDFNIVKEVSEEKFKQEPCRGCKDTRALKLEAFEYIDEEEIISLQMGCLICKTTKILRVDKGRFS